MFDEEFRIDLDPLDPTSVFLAEVPYGQRRKATQKWVALAVPQVSKLGPKAYWEAVIAAVEKRAGREFPSLRKDRTRRTVLERYIQAGSHEVAYYLYETVAKNYWNVIAPNRLRRR